MVYCCCSHCVHTSQSYSIYGPKESHILIPHKIRINDVFLSVSVSVCVYVQCAFSRRLAILHAYARQMHRLLFVWTKKNIVVHLSHTNKYSGVEDHFSSRYAIIFAIAVNNDRKQTDNNTNNNHSTAKKGTRQKKEENDLNSLAKPDFNFVVSSLSPQKFIWMQFYIQMFWFTHFNNFGCLSI